MAPGTPFPATGRRSSPGPLPHSSASEGAPLTAPSERIVTPQFVLLCGGGLLFFLSFFLILPALPLYARGHGVPESQIGFIIGIVALSAMMVRPVAGWAADRWGRKPLMLGGAAIFLCSSLLYGLSVTAPALVAVRVLHGTGMGLYPTAVSAMVADLAPVARRGKAIGIWGAASNVALALGPLGAVWIVERWGFSTLFVVSAAIALATLVLATIQQETLLEPRHNPLRPSGLLSRQVAFPSLIVFCMMATYGIQVGFLPLYAQAHGGNPGVFFLVLALVIAAVRSYAGQLSDRLGRPPVVAAGMLFTAVALVIQAVWGGPEALIVVGVVHGLGLGTAQPPLMAWTVDLVPAAERGKAMGTYYTALELGIGMGTIGFGLLLARAGFPLMYLVTGALGFVGAALAAIRIKMKEAT